MSMTCALMKVKAPTFISGQFFAFWKIQVIFRYWAWSTNLFVYILQIKTKHITNRVYAQLKFNCTFAVKYHTAHKPLRPLNVSDEGVMTAA